MTRLLITEAGEEKIITDIASYRTERNQVRIELASIYANYEVGSRSSLYCREDKIVALVNRFHELEDVIARFEHAEQRDANIDAGWNIVSESQREDES